jgi:hypothetical protein
VSIEDSGAGNVGARFDVGAEQFEVVDPVRAGDSLKSGGGSDGSDLGDDGEFDPAVHTGKRNADGSWRRKRGAGRGGSPGGSGGGGGRSAGRQKAKGYSVTGVEQLLFSIHLGVAAIAKAPELALTQTEANTLAKAGIAVAELYDFDVAKEAVVWGNLIIAGASIYGPKVIGAMMRKKAEGARNVTPQAPLPVATEQAPQFHRAEAPQPKWASPFKGEGGTPPATMAETPNLGPDFFK